MLQRQLRGRLRLHAKITTGEDQSEQTTVNSDTLSSRLIDTGLFALQLFAELAVLFVLISFLVGLILAFVGVMQLQLFGAQIYVADLVGIAMVRVLGAVMTGIIMAGRTGAAFAAQLGTMQVNEELDALEVMGISPMEFLVLPRMLALILMMPLLCLYADLMGVLGGLIVAVTMLDINLLEYYNQTISAVRKPTSRRTLSSRRLRSTLAQRLAPRERKKPTRPSTTRKAPARRAASRLRLETRCIFTIPFSKRAS